MLEHQHTLFALQPTSFCNLNCSYCYLTDRANKHTMSASLYEIMIKKIMSSPLSKACTISWNLGEPLSVGIEFYKKVFKLFDQYNIHNHLFRHHIQTNGVLIDQAWIDLFKLYNVSIGISIDGPEFIHDLYRLDLENKGTHAKVQSAIDLLRKNAIPLKAVCVVTDFSLLYAEQIFDYFINNQFSVLSLTPEEIENEGGNSSIYENNLINNKDKFVKYKSFISKIFDLWRSNKSTIRIKEFDSVLLQVKAAKDLHFTPPSTILNSTQVISIDSIGNIYAFSPELTNGTKKDKYQFAVGNILEIENLLDITQNDNFKRLSSSIELGIKKCQKECEYFDICGSGYFSNKLYENGSFESTQTNFCILTKQIITDVIICNLSKP